MPISNDYARLPLDHIVVPEGRQRAKVETGGLRESIAKLGVLKPIIVSRAEGEAHAVLVAGERRLTASHELGLSDIPVRWLDDVTAEERAIIELEENLKRSDLHWLDYVRAVIAIHKTLSAVRSDWTRSLTADELSISASYVNQILAMEPHLGNPKVTDQPSWSLAKSVVDRLTARATQDAMAQLDGISVGALTQALAAVPEVTPSAAAAVEGVSLLTPTAAQSVSAKIMAMVKEAKPPAAAPSVASSRPDNIILGDFIPWAETYEGPKFNFLHCDFPYGVGIFDDKRPNSGRWSADHAYSDTKEVYFGLIEALCKHREKLLTQNSHIMFWFSMEYYARTMAMFRELAPDIKFLNHPLVWLKSDNAGVLPDRNRAPRRIYETALFGMRGDRYVAKAVSNGYSAPTDRALHPSAKPEPVLRHFFQLFVDSATTMLDPTCGAGSALRVAEELGAARTLGLERDEAFHGIAVEALHRSRLLREGAKAVKGGG